MKGDRQPQAAGQSARRRATQQIDRSTSETMDLTRSRADLFICKKEEFDLSNGEDRSCLPVIPRECYAISGEFARGGMGRVMLAEDRRLGRPVLIKELLRNDPKHQKRFEREAMITARLQHPSIVTVTRPGDGRPGSRSIR